MKNFIKMVFAVICGLFLAGIIGLFLLSGFASALSAGSGSTPAVPKSGALVLDLSKLVISEQTSESNPISMLNGTGTKTLGIWDAVQALNIAATDPAIKFLYLKADGSSLGLACAEELRASIAKFRESGKAVIAYTEATTTGSYYLSSVADKVYMTSYQGATTMLNGVSGQLIFLKDLLDRLGVNVQLIRHGKYKSAGEMFVRNSASEDNYEQNLSYITSIWKTYSEAIAESRGISEDKLNSAIDELKLCIPEDFVKEGLVDSLMTRGELQAQLAKLCGVDDFKDYKEIGLADYAKAKIIPNLKAKKTLAVIYANGDIVDGTAKQQVAGDRFAAIIEKVRKDSCIKAVVLRVSSPGGSVLASEKIKEELDLLKKNKPLIASYGEYAASGGYWISNNCDKIFSDATTLTGSIGVFSMIPDFSKTARNVLHVNVTSVNSNKHGDWFSLMRPLDQAEQRYMLRSIENIYDKFTDIVAQGRGLEKEYVDEIGQGRVWTGAQGLEIKLVDEIGTLEDAIHYAALAGGEEELSEWVVTQYPKPASSMDSLLELLGESKGEDAKAVYSVRNWYKALKEGNASLFFARMPYDVTIL